MEVAVTLRNPVIGIGAPASWFVPEAARRLKTQTIIPPHADVANAVGAITSHVHIRRRVRITPDEKGRYVLRGLPDAPVIKTFDRAHAHAIAALRDAVRLDALVAGTNQSRVEIEADDRIAPLGDGGQLFLERVLTARLTGRPNLALHALEK